MQSPWTARPPQPFLRRLRGSGCSCQAGERGAMMLCAGGKERCSQALSERINAGCGGRGRLLSARVLSSAGAGGCARARPLPEHGARAAARHLGHPAGRRRGRRAGERRPCCLPAQTCTVTAAPAGCSAQRQALCSRLPRSQHIYPPFLCWGAVDRGACGLHFPEPAETSVA